MNSEPPIPKALNHSEKEQIHALNKLIVECDELRELEKLVGNFNLFRTLGFVQGEIRHSNVLAWILQPQAPHGLRDLFLRKWLMRILHDSALESPDLELAEIDSSRFSGVRVLREWRHIDVLIDIRLENGDQWVVAIENKIWAGESPGQIKRYLDLVEKEFSSARARIYIFLSQREQEPSDARYHVATYEQVYETLKDCLEEQREVIGEDPKVLLTHYLKLLEESFIENTRVAQLAQKIYESHRTALDLILEHRPDAMMDVGTLLKKKLEENTDSLGIVMMPTVKGYVRFIPKAWDLPQNRAGTAWGQNSAYVLLEVSLWGKFVILKIVEGRAPTEWRNRLWELSRSAPFSHTQRRNRQPAQWMSISSVKSTFSLTALEDITSEDLADKIYEWVEGQLQGDFLSAIDKMSEEIKKLPPSLP